MRSRLVALFGVVMMVMMVGLVPTATQAKKPLDVDCDVLETTIEDVDDFLDAQVPPVQFESLGALVSGAKKDPVLFAQLSVLVSFFSGGTINFTDPKEVVPTIAKCGLIPHLIEQIND